MNDNKDQDQEIEKILESKEASPEFQEATIVEESTVEDPVLESITNAGLGSVNMDRFGRERAAPSDLHLGWMELDIDSLPSRGMFYPTDTVIKIRAAKAAEIRHFSTLDETNFIDMEEKLNSIIESCTMVNTPSKRMSYKDICEEDRIVLLLKIRDLTFPEPENKIVFNAKSENGSKLEIDLSTDYLVPSEIPSEIRRYYDEDDRTFVIQTKSAGTVYMKPPSIGVMQEVTKYLKDRKENDQEIDQAFIQVLPYIVSDWRGLNAKKIFELEIEHKRWSEKKFMVIYRLAEKMKIGVSTTLEKEIDGEVFKAPLEFPGGIKSLFIISDLSGELL